jgi:hypothetical protein
MFLEYIKRVWIGVRIIGGINITLCSDSATLTVKLTLSQSDNF